MEGLNVKTGYEKYVFDLALFLASSARGCIDEPPAYASFRLLDALERIIELPAHIPYLKSDPFLERVKGMIEENKYLVLTDLERFKGFLDSLVREMAKEAKKRVGKA